MNASHRCKDSWTQCVLLTKIKPRKLSKYYEKFERKSEGDTTGASYTSTADFVSSPLTMTVSIEAVNASASSTEPNGIVTHASLMLRNVIAHFAFAIVREKCVIEWSPKPSSLSVNERLHVEHSLRMGLVETSGEVSSTNPHAGEVELERAEGGVDRLASSRLLTSDLMEDMGWGDCGDVLDEDVTCATSVVQGPGRCDTGVKALPTVAPTSAPPPWYKCG